MATVQNTVKYLFLTADAGVASGVTRTMSLTATIGERPAGAVIKHAWVEFWAAPTSNVAASAISLKLKANGDTTGLTQSGDPGINAGAQSLIFDGIFQGDDGGVARTYLESTWGSLADSALVLDVVVTGPSHNNAVAALNITYEYDTALVTTRTKTVELLVGEFNGKLTGTLQTVATIPRLDGASEANGTGDSIAVSGGTATLTDAGAAFTASMIGKAIVIASAPTSANNGEFMITAVPSGTTIQYENAAGVAESAPAATWNIHGFGLVESSLVMKQAAAIFQANQGNPVPFGAFEVDVGSEPTITFGTETHQSRNYGRLAWYATGAPTSLTAAQTVQARVTSAGGTPQHFSNVTVRACYTYTYASTTPRVAVAGYRYVSDGEGQIGGIVEADGRSIEWTHLCTGSPTRQGPLGVLTTLMDSVQLPLNCRGEDVSRGVAQAGSRLYDMIRWPDTGEHVCSAHRMDPAGAASTSNTGVKLRKGRNKLRLIQWIDGTTYGDTHQYGTQPGHLYFYAYNQATPAAGAHAIQRTISTALSTYRYVTSPSGRNKKITVTPIALTAGLYFHGVGLELTNFQLGPAISVFFQMARRSDEGPDAKQSWVPVSSSGAYGSYDMDMCLGRFDVSKLFARWPAAPGGLMAPLAVRKYNVQCGQRVMGGVRSLLEIEELTRTVSVTVTGYGGTGTGIEVDVYRADTDELIARLTTTTGAASFTWPDDLVSLYAVAREDGTHLGRSDDSTGTSIAVAFPASAPPPSIAFNEGFD